MARLWKKYKLLILCVAALILVVLLAWLTVTQLTTKRIHLTVDGRETSFETTSFTVEELLEEKNFHLVKEDYLTPSTDEILLDDEEIEIIHSVPFTLQADGKTTSLRALPRTVGEALAYHGVKVGRIDRVRPAMDKPLKAGAKVVINRITMSEKQIVEDVKFKTETRGDGDLPAGTTKVVQEGKKGQDRVTYTITYSDGKEIKREETARETLTKPQKEIIAKSTRGTIAGAEYRKKFTVKAYSYTGGGRTASGTRARVGEIAVDPRVIPLGTRVYVEGYGFARAEDTGGNIKGNTIDVYKTSEGACRRWGVRYVTVYILT